MTDSSEANSQAVTPAAAEGRAAPSDEQEHWWTKWLVLIFVVTLLAGILFGYDQGVIAGALNGMTKEFDLSSTMKEVITSWVTLGALFGALVAGMLADRLGRRTAILLAAALFTAGALLESLAPDTAVLVVGRLVVGFGVGVASVAAPLYAAETAPTHLRGRFVSSYQLAITIGIFVAYVVDWALTNSDSWRVMLGVSAVPAVLLLIAAWPLRDTPRWYMKAGRRDDAREALLRIRDADQVENDLDGIQSALDKGEEASWKEVFGKDLRKPLSIAIGLAVFQQFTGINAIIYYANEIFADAGFNTPQEQAAATTWSIGAVNVVATFIAIAYIDRFGRKPLLQAGLVGMGLSLTVVGISFLFLDDSSTHASDAGIVTLVALVVFIASFAFSLGPVTWTVINEVFPNRVRGRAVSVATAVNWLSAWVVSQFFLTLVDLIGPSATFWLFATFSAIAFVWIWLRVPETKGKSLEEIEAMLLPSEQQPEGS
ncbi:MAG: sugar porter family MFS transporter [Actinomycetia bacterium]|nr:sugar porter family MFS transporter [Actinomycetes bacterium]